MGILSFPKWAQAVPPPDFLFNIGSQIAYTLSFVAIFFSATFGVVYQFLKVKVHAYKPKPLRFLLILLLLSAFFLGIAYWYNTHQQEAAYLTWLEESESYNKQFDETQETVIELPPVQEEEESSVFWEEYQDTPLSISNTDFDALIQSNQKDYIVLDARENLEYGYGRFPGSVHLRYADILAGLTQSLPKDQFIYVLCWSGIRGEETAQMLREQGFVAIYLEKGADGWVSEYGGLWEGDIKFSSLYPDTDYALTFTTDQTKQMVSEGVILVDAREPEKIATSSIDAYGMPIMLTPTSELEAMYAQIPEGSRVLTICDEYTNCFMAKILGVELEIRGAEFLGRYNKPWEY